MKALRRKAPPNGPIHDNVLAEAPAVQSAVPDGPNPSTAAPFDPTPYLHIGSFSIRSAFFIVRQLLAAAPSDATPESKAALRAVRKIGEEIRVIFNADGQDRPTTDPRRVDALVDLRWTNVYRRIEAYATLPVERYPDAGVAKALLGNLFRNGRSFLNLPYADEWAESERLLTRIVDEGLEDALDRIVGPAFLFELRLAHAEYGAVLGTVTARAIEPKVNRAGPLDRCMVAINEYAFLVCAEVIAKKRSASSAAAALEPIVAFKDAQVGRRAPPEEPPAPASGHEPLPAVP